MTAASSNDHSACAACQAVTSNTQMADSCARWGSRTTDWSLRGRASTTRPFAENPGRIIVVRCGQCNEDYDVREVVNERQHPAAAHVMAFDCPRGHRSEARRVFKTG